MRERPNNAVYPTFNIQQFVSWFWSSNSLLKFIFYSLKNFHILFVKQFNLNFYISYEFLEWQNLLSYSRHNRNASVQPKSAVEKNILKQLDQFLPRYYDWQNDMPYEKSLKELENMQDIYKQAYRKHIIYVRALIPKHQLLEWNVKEGWSPLCKFLKVEEPEIPFPGKVYIEISTTFKMNYSIKFNFWVKF